jgi:hypothetical protein
MRAKSDRACTRDFESRCFARRFAQKSRNSEAGARLKNPRPITEVEHARDADTRRRTLESCAEFVGASLETQARRRSDDAVHHTPSIGGA